MNTQGSHITTPLFDEKLIRHWIELLNQRNFEKGKEFMTDEIELFGNCVLEIIPDSQGLLKSKRTVSSFLQIFFRRFSERLYTVESIRFVESKAIVQLKDEQGEMHYLGMITDSQQKIKRLEMCETNSCT